MPAAPGAQVSRRTAGCPRMRDRWPIQRKRAGARGLILAKMAMDMSQSLRSALDEGGNVSGS